MQQTRRHILDILKRRGQATVDDIVNELQRRRGNITAVTVRHHLMRLQQEELITSPELRRRNSPGRPQHVYSLTDKAKAHFPNNYERLAAGLIEQLQKHLPPEGVNVILEGVADDFSSGIVIPEGELSERLDAAVEFLSQRGYEADWEVTQEGYVLHTSNCPYHGIAETTQALCDMDMRLISNLLGVVPRRITHKAQGEMTCSYLIPQHGA